MEEVSFGVIGSGFMGSVLAHTAAKFPYARCVGAADTELPHAEGLADPLAFVKDLHGFTEAEVKLVMRDNALALLNG